MLSKIARSNPYYSPVTPFRGNLDLNYGPRWKQENIDSNIKLDTNVFRTTYRCTFLKETVCQLPK